MTNSGDAPLLSICIPTYNRVSSLSNLLDKLCDVKKKYQGLIEICISDNASSDLTNSLLQDYQDKLGLNIQRQSSNVGGTLNIISVAQMMKGKWGMLLGDDDELELNGLSELIEVLRKAKKGTWLLCEASGSEGAGLYFTSYLKEHYLANEFLRETCIRGLNAFGFMGVHIFPVEAVGIFSSLTIENSRPWPHMAAMLEAIVLQGYGVKIINSPLVNQARGGQHLFWAAGDMAEMRLSKICIVRNVIKKVAHRPIVLSLIMLRELYSFDNLKHLIKWKLFENHDFNDRAGKVYFDVYRQLGPLIPLGLLHGLVFAILQALPFRGLLRVLKFLGGEKHYHNYNELKESMIGNDGIQRGI
jgi:glycosyltransferase involved in cell wall biosynthesis